MTHTLSSLLLLTADSRHTFLDSWFTAFLSNEDLSTERLNRKTSSVTTSEIISAEQIILRIQRQISVNLRRKRKLHYQRYNITIVRSNSQLVADCGSTESAESVRRAGDGSSDDQEPFNVIIFSRQWQPVLVTELPSSVDEERRCFELAVPR